MEWKITDISQLTREQEQSVLHHMDSARRQSVEAMGSDHRRAVTILGEWMAKSAVANALGRKWQEIQLERDGNGKPYAVHAPQVYFNISHSGNRVICAVNNTPIGVDMEEFREVDFRILRRVCTADDRSFLFGTASFDTEADWQSVAPETLLQLWTAKEAYLKCIGVGLAGLSKVSYREILPFCRQWREGKAVVSIVTDLPK